MTLAPGESLVLFTDGVSEAEDLDGNQLSSAQLAGWLQSAWGVGAEEIIRRIEAEVLLHIGETPLDDDVTIMVMSRKA